VPTFFDTLAKVTFLRVALGGDREPVTSITVPAHAARSVSVLIEAPVMLGDGSVYGGYLTFTPTAGVATPVSVPYAGFKGDYQALNVVAIEPRLLARNAAGTLVAASAGRVYTMRGGNLPAFSIGLGYGVDQISARIVGLDGSAWIVPVAAFTYDMMRRSNPGTPATFSSGDFDASVLPDGRYRFEIDMVRALGDASNPRHHQIVSTPWFAIQRPATAP
jgi:minor extracellular serine protease Vpr